VLVPYVLYIQAHGTTFTKVHDFFLKFLMFANLITKELEDKLTPQKLRIEENGGRVVACFSFTSSLSHFNYQRFEHNSILKKLGNENNGFNHERIHRQINVHEKAKK
jgi:hypothetical protein